MKPVRNLAAAGLARVCGHSFLGGLLSPDSVVFDLGANRGEFAREVRRQFGCRVHAVEPSPGLAASMRGQDWLTVTEAALSASGGTVRLVVSGNPEASYVWEEAEAPLSGPLVEVPALTLERLMAGAPLAIDLMKMDIEGAELQVLESASEQTLQRIRQLTVEFHQFLDPGLRGRIQALKRRLHRLGFWSLDFSRCNYDVLFVRHPLGVSRLARLQLTAQKYGAMAGRLASGARARSWSGAASTARSLIL